MESSAISAYEFLNEIFPGQESARVYLEARRFPFLNPRHNHPEDRFPELNVVND